MSNQDQNAPGVQAEARRRRQAEALRANLARRKNQNRARTEESAAPADDHDAGRLAPDDDKS